MFNFIYKTDVLRGNKLLLAYLDRFYSACLFIEFLTYCNINIETNPININRNIVYRTFFIEIFTFFNS